MINNILSDYLNTTKYKELLQFQTALYHQIYDFF